MVSRSCMVNDMSSGKALGERERHLIVAETIGLPLVLYLPEGNVPLKYTTYASSQCFTNPSRVDSYLI